MLNTANQLKKNAAQAMDTAQNLLQFSLENTAKLASLQLELSKNILEETTNTLKNISKVTSPQQLFTHVNQFATSTVEKNIDSCRSVYEIITATQSHLGKIVESHFRASNINADNLTSWLSKFQTTKLDTANSALDSIVKNTNQVLSTANALTSQAREVANDNIKSTAKTVESVVETTAKAATKNIETVMASAKNAASSAVESVIKATDTVVETVKNAAGQAQGTNK